jgi:hypothetical protein
VKRKVNRSENDNGEKEECRRKGGKTIINEKENKMEKKNRVMLIEQWKADG